MSEGMMIDWRSTPADCADAGERLLKAGEPLLAYDTLVGYGTCPMNVVHRPREPVQSSKFKVQS